MKSQKEILSYQERYRNFARKCIERKFGSRRVRRGAACQEFIRYAVDLSACPVAQEGGMIVVWAGAGNLMRIADFGFSVTGNDTFTINLPGDEYHTALLLKDIEMCTHRLPAALCIEPRSACLDIAAEEVQDWLDAFDAAGLCSGHECVTAAALTQYLQVPASCKMVLEGYIQRSEVLEALQTDNKRLTVHVTCITGQL